MSYLPRIFRSTNFFSAEYLDLPPKKMVLPHHDFSFALVAIFTFPDAAKILLYFLHISCSPSGHTHVPQTPCDSSSTTPQSPPPPHSPPLSIAAAKAESVGPYHNPDNLRHRVGRDQGLTICGEEGQRACIPCTLLCSQSSLLPPSVARLLQIDSRFQTVQRRPWW